MELLIRESFEHVKEIGPHVAEGHYDLVGPSGEIVLPQIWETVIEPDWTVTMHVWPMQSPTQDLDPPVSDPFLSATSPSPRAKTKASSSRKKGKARKKVATPLSHANSIKDLSGIPVPSGAKKRETSSAEAVDEPYASPLSGETIVVEQVPMQSHEQNPQNTSKPSGISAGYETVTDENDLKKVTSTNDALYEEEYHGSIAQHTPCGMIRQRRNQVPTTEKANDAGGAEEEIGKEEEEEEEEEQGEVRVLPSGRASMASDADAESECETESVTEFNIRNYLKRASIF